MTTIHQAETGRRLAVMNSINRLLDGLNRKQEACGLPPIESVAGPEEALRLEHIEALVKQIRASHALGETNPTIVGYLAAQVAAWCIALEERDEVRVP